MTNKKENTIISSEADFVRFCRSLYQGKLLEAGVSKQQLTFPLSESALNIIRTDMAKACLTFLMREGGVARKMLANKGGKNTSLNKTDKNHGDKESLPLIKFHFSADILAYLLSVYSRNDFDITDKSFTVSDGILITLLLDRIYPLDNAHSLIARSGYFSEETLSQLITLIPFVQVNFYDRLPEDFEEVKLEPCEDANLFITAFSALTPYTVKRWERIEYAFWERDQDPKKIARFAGYRGLLSRQVVSICKKSNRLEVFDTFAILMKNIFKKDFYDVGRSMPQIEEALNKAVEGKLKELHPAFSVFYSRRHASYPPKYIEVASIFDLIGKSEALLSWQPKEVFSFLFDLPDCRIASDITRLFERNETVDTEQTNLVIEYLKEKIQLYMKDFFCEQYTWALNILHSKYYLLTKEKREEIGVWVSEQFRDIDINYGSEIGSCLFWMLTRRIRMLLEADLINSKEIDIDKNLQSQWEQRQKHEKEIESGFEKLIEDRFDNINSWKLGLRLEKLEIEQQVIETILNGYAFVDSLIELEKWGNTLDCYDKKEAALRGTVLKTLDKIAIAPIKLKEWGLNMKPAIDEFNKQRQIDKFEAEPNKNNHTVLIVYVDTDEPKVWTIALFNDKGVFINNELIDDVNNELAIELELAMELNKEERNKDRIIELATSYLGLTQQKDLFNRFQNMQNVLGYKISQEEGMV